MKIKTYKTIILLIVAIFFLITFVVYHTRSVKYDKMGEAVDITPSSGFDLNSLDEDMRVKIQAGEYYGHFSFRGDNTVKRYFVIGYPDNEGGEIEYAIVIKDHPLFSVFSKLITPTPGEYVEGYVLPLPQELKPYIAAKLKNEGFKEKKADSMIVPYYMVYVNTAFYNTVKTISAVGLIACVAFWLVFVLLTPKKEENAEIEIE